jgi:hypothetical protein
MTEEKCDSFHCPIPALQPSRHFQRLETGWEYALQLDRGGLMKTVAVVLALLLSQTTCRADDEERTQYHEVIPREHSTIETVQYLGIIYVLSFGTYLLVSRDEVFHNASFQNYISNFGNLTFFDQDLPSANWGVHIYTGANAYQFYRARSYTMTDAFFLTLAQECLYQFTVETLVQPTGLENVVNTTIFGTILGRGLEVASLPMMNSDFFAIRGLGYLFNLPALFGFYESKTKIYPMVGNGRTGVELQISI